jgi:hypothetical protein
MLTDILSPGVRLKLTGTRLKLTGARLKLTGARLQLTGAPAASADCQRTIRCPSYQKLQIFVNLTFYIFVTLNQV